MLSDFEIRGGGSGGGGDDGPNVVKSVDGAWEIAANQVVLLSRPPAPDPTSPAATPQPNLITILATGSLPTMNDGRVDIRGGKGVRITTGGPALPLFNPPVTSDKTDGVEIVVGAQQKIVIHRGILPLASINLNQRIELTMDNIVVDAGLDGKLTLKAGPSEITMDAEGITFSVMDGMSFISMAADGITMFGTPTVQLNPMGSPPPDEEEPAEEVDSATA
jgi:hypothetical protein